MKCILVTEKKMSDEHKHTELIFRYLTHEADANEIRLVNSLRSTDPEFAKLFQEFSKTWSLTDTEIPSEISEINVDSEWEHFKNQVVKRNDSVKIIPIRRNKKSLILKLAAILILLIGIGFLIKYSVAPTNLEFASTDKILEKTLSDSSIVTLSKSSKVTYNEDFNKEFRKLKLVGEAFFEVKHNSEKKFIVETNSVFVEVTGTEFYVQTTDLQTDVIVKSGKVSVYKSENGSDTVRLAAGEKAHFDVKSDQLIKVENEDKNYISWKTKTFVFDNETLPNVLKTLEKAYFVKFELRNKQLSNCRISSSFDDQTIEGILSVLQTLLDIKVTKNGTIYSIEGKGC